TLAAAETLEVKPAVIISLGASSFGATRSGFNLLHLHTLLLEQGVFRTPPLAVSLGGEEDSGLSFDPDVRSTLTEQVSRSGIPLLQERDLRKNVLDRMRRYDGMARGGRIAAYINIGGSHTNLGTSALVLQLRPGLNRHPALPPEANRGVVSEMAARGIPVIHLLYVRGLAERYGLPWDPIPLPEAGAWRPSEGPEEGLRFWVIFAAYFMALGILTGRIDRRGRGSRSGTAALS
ncbi:MAG: poly-gamma-glutamate system protein, partial [Acidobacteria bacterium]|nr:poly-gamma-glutamate system protein [Acidobacteriota bacterium]